MQESWSPSNHKSILDMFCLYLTFDQRLHRTLESVYRHFYTAIRRDASKGGLIIPPRVGE